MHRVRSTGGKASLQANAALTPADFESIALELGHPPMRARKIGFVAARKVENDEVVETHSNGKETTNTARAGDFVVTNLAPDRRPLCDAAGEPNVYVIASDKFASLYEPTSESSKHGAIYRAKGVVSALPFSGGIDIVAPWGERQITADGYLLLNGNEVYASSRAAFEGTYQVLDP